MKQFIKRIVPKWALALHRERFRRKHEQQLLDGIPESSHRLYQLSELSAYDHIRLSPASESVRQAVKGAAESISGEEWNFYSDALRIEIVQGFVETIDKLSFSSVNYLEIGSCQGISMALIGSLLGQRRGTLTSIDPYFETGYWEGEKGPYQQKKHIKIDKATRSHAQSLYASMALPVTIHELTSIDGLRLMIQNEQRFHLIYIDGCHEQLWPAIDFGLSCAVLVPGGAIILDDHLWPDVQPIKQLCDKHGRKIQETWKTASYCF